MDIEGPLRLWKCDTTNCRMEQWLPAEAPEPVCVSVDKPYHSHRRGRMVRIWEGEVMAVYLVGSGEYEQEYAQFGFLTEEEARAFVEAEPSYHVMNEVTVIVASR